MRLVAGALALILFSSFARAEGTGAAEPIRPAAEVTHGKVPWRVVRVMSQSHQALLFDRARETHILAEVGSKLDGYAVEAIDEDEVTLSLDGKQIVLAAPARGGRRRPDRDLGAMHVRSATAARQTDTMAGPPTSIAPTPVDPYGEVAIRVASASGAAEPRPAGPPSRAIEAGEGGVRVAEAPASDDRMAEGKVTGIRVVEAPTGMPEQAIHARALADVMSSGNAAHGARTPASGSLPMAAPAPAADPRPVITAQLASEIRTAPVAPSEAVVLMRGEVDGALADFARLAAGVRGSFSPAGLVVEGVGDGSIFQRAGLRAGDVITAVDGARLRSLEDAANLYARASTARAITAQVVRGGKSMTLRVAIQ